MTEISKTTLASGNNVLGDETLVFFGSGPVAAKSLELLAENFQIEAIITKPQPAHHKEPFPVLQVAEKLGLKIFTPTGKQALSDLFATKPVASKLGVVIDYGFIINQDVIDYFSLGIVNSHFSLLPEWRGADPITFSVLSGQKQTGVSLMLIVEKMDEGPLLAQAPYDLPPAITTPALTDDLIDVSNQCLKEILPLYFTGKTQPAPQEAVTIAASTIPTYSRKLTKQDGIIDWHKPAEQLEREIRAFLEWPKSRTTLGGKDLVITAAEVVDISGEPGDLLVDGKNLLIYCGAKALSIKKLIPAGKKEMPVEAFLAGYRALLQ